MSASVTLSKHTTGPWTVERDGLTLTMGHQVVATALAPDGASVEEQRANARLISHAPEMYRAIKACVDLCETGFRQFGMQGPDRGKMGKIWFETYERFRALLTKIEGTA